MDDEFKKFRDREEAGELLAKKLQNIDTSKVSLILALPRGGVPVAYQIAKNLKKPLDVFIVRKLGVPSQPELAFGAIADNGVEVYNQALLKEVHLKPEQITAVKDKELIELKRREEKYRGIKPLPDLKGRTIILVDDGIATGATVRVAIKALQAMKIKKIILAVPVMSEKIFYLVAEKVDTIIVLKISKYFNAVGEWYQDFSQTEDQEVYELLRKQGYSDKPF